MILGFVRGRKEWRVWGRRVESEGGAIEEEGGENFGPFGFFFLKSIPVLISLSFVVTCEKLRGFVVFPLCVLCVTTVVVFGKDEEVEVEVEEVEVCHETSTFFAVRGERERERARACSWACGQHKGHEA